MEHLEENEELYRAWIGTKKQDEYIQKMRTRGFNWVAFIIPNILFITRKMYIESILLLIVFLVSFIIENNPIASIAYSIIEIILLIGIGFSYYRLYRWHIKRKIEKYKRKGLSYEEQLEIATKFGGDTFTVLSLAVFIIELIIVISASLLMTKISDSNNLTNNDIIYNNYMKNYNNSSNKYNYYNYYNDNSYLNDNFNQDTYFNNTNNDKQKSWDLGSFNLTYNPDDWKEGSTGDEKYLKYKNTENYITYVNSSINLYGLSEVKDKDFQNNYEQEFKQKLQSKSTTKNINFVDSYWYDLSEKICIGIFECTCSDDDLGFLGYITYYFCYSERRTYTFMVVETESDVSFLVDSWDVIETIKNNSQI